MPTLDFGERVGSTMAHIEVSEHIHSDYKAAIVVFKRDLTLDVISDARIQKPTSQLKMIAEHVGRTRFEEMGEEEVKELVGRIQDRE